MKSPSTIHNTGFSDFFNKTRGRKGSAIRGQPRPFQARGRPLPCQASAGPRQASARRTVGCIEAHSTATFARRERFNRPCAQARKEKCQVLSKPRATESIFESILRKRQLSEKITFPKIGCDFFSRARGKLKMQQSTQRGERKLFLNFWGERSQIAPGIAILRGRPKTFGRKLKLLNHKF